MKFDSITVTNSTLISLRLSLFCPFITIPLFQIFLFKSFNFQQNYMETKKAKLQYQVNVLDKHENISFIFQGISIFVNGYTGDFFLFFRIEIYGNESHVRFFVKIVSFTKSWMTST